MNAKNITIQIIVINLNKRDDYERYRPATME